ncbi:DNA cytosine methyltransferase [Pseudomonas syringae]|uniref:DNA cytosine methyltransferase n=1 Tax=Pseudomonas syringae TaxID=317 RepID=UPI001F0D3E22|nr:DNA cytosine methyltransferase [Pseudomonas syringae]MCH5508863.1 DNA cytosine methyltransferase [Pseudomonas syringae pv. syringae]MCH5637634.1 DNA cytosine methyltransferase [Pseudomonas syringae pv. syringae]MCH7426767.1 DNA cytosine methyltransferase [Pseudomonas syringae pv. syringae]
MLEYGSVCSGIEAATVAWHPLGLKPAWFAEIEPFPSAVLAHHYPRTPNLGDMTKLGALVLAGKINAPDVLVGGTPCQAFSVAGMRQGMLDPRGALTIKYVELADAVDHVRTSRNQPESILIWENVPGVLSDKGNAFGCFLGALAGEDCELQPPGKRWQDAGCVYGPKRTIAWRILDAQYFGLAQRRRRVFLVASARADFDPIAVLFEREGVRRDCAPRRSPESSLHPTLTAQGGGALDDREAYVLETDGIRRTSVIEWERCQGFPDDYTLIPWRSKPAVECPDSPRYKAIGNSKAVPVVRWIGIRIQNALST